MTAPPSSPASAPIVEPPPTRSGLRWVGRIAILVFAVLMVGMWAGIFLGFFDRTAPGTLDDDAFSTQAEPICAAFNEQLDALPKAFQTTDHVARADVVAQSNVDLRAMLDKLAAIAPTEGRDGRMTQEWLGDWSTYVGNREDYASRLRDDETARFLSSTKSSATEQISKPIDRFAYVNHMGSCDTPGDMS